MCVCFPPQLKYTTYIYVADSQRVSIFQLTICGWFLAMCPQIGSIAANREPEGWMNNDMKVRSLNNFCIDRRSNTTKETRSFRKIHIICAYACCACRVRISIIRVRSFFLFFSISHIAVLKVCTNSVTWFGLHCWHVHCDEIESRYTCWSRCFLYVRVYVCMCSNTCYTCPYTLMCVCAFSEHARAFDKQVLGWNWNGF